MTTLATYWSMTINNPDANDYVLVQNPNEKYIRQVIWTDEEGADGTPHIQAWVRLQRNNSLAFIKKLFPRGHFRHILKDDYNENTHSYAQKGDETTRGLHTITLNDPLPALDTTLYKVLERAFEDLDNEAIVGVDDSHMLRLTKRAESLMIREKKGLEKVFISAVYRKMKTEYWHDTLHRLRFVDVQEVVVPMTNGDDTNEDGQSEASGLCGSSGETEEEDCSESEGDCSSQGSQEDSDEDDGR